jgi:hypothetical protein
MELERKWGGDTSSHMVVLVKLVWSKTGMIMIVVSHNQALVLRLALGDNRGRSTSGFGSEIHQGLLELRQQPFCIVFRIG